MKKEPEFEVLQVEEGVVDYALALALATAPIGAAADTIFKCKGADGSMHYQSTKCVASAEVSSWGMREAPVTFAKAEGTAPVVVTALEIRQAENGVFYADGTVNGTPAQFMVDSGASGVAIPTALGESLGLRCTSTSFISSANGNLEVCNSRVRSIKLGKFELHDVPVIVTNTSAVLLGQTALRHFKMEQENGVLRLSLKAKR